MVVGTILNLSYFLLWDTSFMVKSYRWGGWVALLGGWVGGSDGWPRIFSCQPLVFFENGASSKIDDVLAEDGELLHVLPLAVHLNFFLMDK